MVRALSLEVAATAGDRRHRLGHTGEHPGDGRHGHPRLRPAPLPDEEYQRPYFGPSKSTYNAERDVYIRPPTCEQLLLRRLLAVLVGIDVGLTGDQQFDNHGATLDLGVLSIQRQRRPTRLSRTVATTSADSPRCCVASALPRACLTATQRWPSPVAAPSAPLAPLASSASSRRSRPTSTPSGVVTGSASTPRWRMRAPASRAGTSGR